jgi:hypothetical protein
MSREIIAKQEEVVKPELVETGETQRADPEAIAEFGIRWWRSYQRMLKEIVSEGDFVEFPVRGKKMQVPTRQWVSKLIRIHQLDVRIEPNFKEDGVVIVKAIATTPSGRQVEDFGVSSTKEVEGRTAGKEPLHIALATATTRAINRAVLRLTGAGQVSAEELAPAETEEPEVEPIQPKPIQPTPQPRPQPQPQQKTNSTHRPMTPEEKETYWKKHSELVEAIIQAFGDEDKAIAYAEKKFGHIRRLWDLHNSHLETILEEISSLSAEQEEEIDLPKPREERLL